MQIDPQITQIDPQITQITQIDPQITQITQIDPQITQITQIDPQITQIAQKETNKGEALYVICVKGCGGGEVYDQASHFPPHEFSGIHGMGSK